MKMNTFFASAIFITSLLLILSACRPEKTARSTGDKQEAMLEQVISLSEPVQTVEPEPVEEAEIEIETEIEMVQQEQEDNIEDETDYYALAYEELAQMLSGARKPDFERAVFVSENPYHNQVYRYEDFQATIDLYEYRVRQLVRANDRSDTLRLDARADANGYFRLADLRYLPEEKKELYRQALSNWAIFAYLTDTTVFYSRKHVPFRYAGEDPFGQKDWSHSQVIGLLRSEDGRGNCFALTALYKILSDRLEAGARICTAPQHIYIQHKDPKGHYYNVELATAGHPGDGTIQTLTHTPSEAIRSGIALRTYDEQQAIGLCLVHLAKSYERQYGLKDAAFMEQCADLVLSYDSLNLNALLLKQQVLDARLKNYALQKGTSHIATLRKDTAVAPLIARLESHLGRLKALGYRQMPVAMQKIILSGEFPAQFTNQNPSPFTTIDPKDEHRKKFHTMYGGLFQEVFVPREQETYGHVVYSSRTKGIVTLDTAAGSDFLIDPVVFAYDFGARMYDARLGRWLSVDPLGAKYPNLSPYNFVGNSPILYVDYDGRDYGVYVDHANKTIIVKATFYTTSSLTAERQSSDQSYNRAVLAARYYQNLKAQYIVKNDQGEEVAYTISFTFDVKKPESSRNNVFETAKADPEGNMFLSGIPGEHVVTEYGNRTGPNTKIRNGEEVHGYTEGLTEKKQFVYVEGAAALENPKSPYILDIHEMGHTLTSLVSEFHNQSGTIMQSDEHQGGGVPGLGLPSGFIENILGNAGLGNAPTGPNKPSAVLHQSGNAPGNFSSGSVKNIENKNTTKK